VTVAEQSDRNTDFYWERWDVVHNGGFSKIKTSHIKKVSVIKYILEDVIFSKIL